MSEFCPVCKNKINEKTIKCNICDFEDLHKEFITKEDGELWNKEVVEPYRKQWENSKKAVLNDGFDEDGYNKDGFDRMGYNRAGFDKDGYDRSGYDKEGFHKLSGYNRDGYDRKGFDRSGYNKDGYDRNGFNRDGYNREGYDKDGFDEHGYDKNGYDKDGFNKKGFNKDGYSRFGAHKSEFDENGYHKLTGYDVWGYNKRGKDVNGKRKKGWTINKIKKNTIALFKIILTLCIIIPFVIFGGLSWYLTYSGSDQIITCVTLVAICILLIICRNKELKLLKKPLYIIIILFSIAHVCICYENWITVYFWFVDLFNRMII